MPIVEVQGQEIEFPDTMTDDQIKGVLRQKFPAQPAERPTPQVQQTAPQSQFDERSAQLKKVINDNASGAINPASAALQSFGTIAGGLNDVVGNALNTGASALGKAAQFVIPDISNAVKTGAGMVADSASPYVMPVVNSALSQYGQFKQAHPEAAGNVEALANIAGLLPVSKGAQPVRGASRVAGEALEASGNAAAQKARTGFVQELITPKETPTVRAEQFANSKEEGLLRNRVVQPTPQEQDVISSVAELPVKPRNSLLKNYTIISDANRAEADKLAAHLAKNDVPVSEELIGSEFSKIQEELAQSPFITGDGETAAKRVLAGAEQSIAKYPRTASGLLDARKDFDGWVKKLKGDKAFNPSVDSPATIAIQKVRQSMNDILDQSIPDAGVKASLRKQSGLYRAMDAIESKGGNEGKNIISRAGQKIAEGIPGKTVAAKAVAGPALATLGIGATAMSPALVGSALAAYGIGKGVMSPTARRAAGAVLKKLGDGSEVFKENSSLPKASDILSQDSTPWRQSALQAQIRKNTKK